MNLLKQTRDICQGLGLEPNKDKGQNFLINPRVIGQIIQAAELKAKDTVLEIGPGLGTLTQALAEQAGQVVAVELDKKLYGYLNSRFAGVNKVKLIQGDILQLLNRELLPDLGSVYKVVANLPYQITSILLRRLLSATYKPQLLVLMVQQEVAERICAEAGEMSVLSVMVQYYCRPQIVSGVGKNEFWPMPQVDSAILKLAPKSARPLAEGTEEKFFKLVKVGFASRRKMLKNNLANVYKADLVESALKAAALDLAARAQELGVNDWLKIYSFLVEGNKKFKQK